MSTRNNDPTNNRVYGGDSGLVHIKDGGRIQFGHELAGIITEKMRREAGLSGTNVSPVLDLCPGCYMVGLFNAAVELALQNGQSLEELGKSMGEAFFALAGKPNPSAVYIESITVQLDTDGERGFYASFSTAQMIGMGF